jgi:hypothetical protein
MDIAGRLRKKIGKVVASGGAEVAIGFGCPGPALRKAADSGEVWLGGRVLTGDYPMRYCKECERSR